MEQVAPPPHDADAIADEDFFTALERRRTTALVQRDLPVIDELHAPEYELVTPSGRVFTRTEYIGVIAREPFYSGWEASEVRVRIVGAMAVLRYRARIQFPSGREVVVWHIDTYEKRAGRWQAVWSQATELRQK
jgi:hypothetical protein